LSWYRAARFLSKNGRRQTHNQADEHCNSVEYFSGTHLVSNRESEMLPVLVAEFHRGVVAAFAIKEVYGRKK
jgi:hypothetical protein